jgi:hypothetical protein
VQAGIERAEGSRTESALERRVSAALWQQPLTVRVGSTRMQIA